MGCRAEHGGAAVVGGGCGRDMTDDLDGNCHEVIYGRCRDKEAFPRGVARRVNCCFREIAAMTCTTAV
jgi:hypothetical protein